MTNKEIDQAFGSFGFGIPKRKYLAIVLASVIAGHGIGVNQFYILKKCKLVNKSRKVTKKGREFLANYLLKK